MFHTLLVTGGLRHIPNHRRLSGCIFRLLITAVGSLKKRLTEKISEFEVISRS
jgi:hypothetical protein